MEKCIFQSEEQILKTTDKEDAIAEVVRVYLDYYELDNRSNLSRNVGTSPIRNTNF